MKYFEAKKYKWIRGKSYRKKVILEKLKNKINLVEEIMIEPLGDIPLHKHQFTNEIFYVLEGNGVLKLKDKEVKIFKGDLIKINKKELHAFRNKKDSPFRMFCFKINFKEGDSYLETH